MNIFFDVDDTLITWDVRLRPGVHEVFQALRDEGHRLYLWSGNGPRWRIVETFDLHPHVIDCFWKPLYRHRERLDELGVTLLPDYVIDDFEEVVQVFGGSVIQPPTYPLERDREMWRIYDEIRMFTGAGARDAAAESA
jgi:hypothetical protein